MSNSNTGLGRTFLTNVVASSGAMVGLFAGVTIVGVIIDKVNAKKNK